ncbi:MAG: iron-containing alcohol dehydrogenase, partial [Eudoraea sp.]|nr:iron-containing alcohol dehydrogenase [Eudoraea sp.]
NDFNSMQKVAISSTLMGLNLAYSSTCLPHRIQYVIGPMTGTSHAQGLIALYKGWIYHLVNKNIKEFVELSKDLQLTPESFAEKIISLKEKLKINYSLSDLGIETNQVEIISTKVSGNLLADPSYKDINSIKHILNNSF